LLCGFLFFYFANVVVALNFLTVSYIISVFLQRESFFCGSFMYLLLVSLVFVSITYAFIFENHSTTQNEVHTVVGFVDDNGRADSTAGSPLSPPRVTYSTFSITMSYLKINLCLAVLVVFISFGMRLVQGVGLLPAFHPYLDVALYCGGFFFYTYRVYNYRTNILLAVAMVFAILCMVCSDIHLYYYFFSSGIAVEFSSYCFLRNGGECAAAEETTYSAAAPIIFTTVTGTGSDLEAQDMSKGNAISVEATPEK
jgi:hypothetical protein